MTKKSPPENLIRAEKLTRTYPFGNGEIHALDHIDLTVQTGEFIGIMGPSGSGKSTLLHLLGALDTPTEGEYWLDNTLIDKKANLAKIRREKIGFVFQTFNLLPHLTAQQNVELPMLYMGVPTHHRQERAGHLLKQVGLKDRPHHLPNQLSGGQRQRVAIARALANEPKLILADEPTGNLDSKSGHEVMKILKDLNKKGTTLILVTHEAYLAKKADRIVKLKDGKIV